TAWGTPIAFIMACFLSGSSLLAQPAGPLLSIRWDGGHNVALSWTNAAPGFVLETATELPPSKGWQGVPQYPQALGFQLVVTQAVALSGQTRFYRLVAKGNQAGVDYLRAVQNADGSWGS